MDNDRAVMLGEIAADAAIERKTFLVDATDQLRRFLDSNGDRIRELGGMVLIDDDPDYLSIAPDGTFRSRSRYQDATTGEWVSETEVIENASELVELYNPADLFAAFAEAAREEAGLPDEPTGAQGLMDTAGIAPDETVGVGIGGSDPYVGAAEDWAATQDEVEAPASEDEAARRLYDLALTFQEQSQLSEARLIEQFEDRAANLTGVLGDFMVVDDEDERLTLRASGSFSAEVVPEDEEGSWRALESPEEIVEFYDPTDVFGDLAESLAEAYPGVASEGVSVDDLEDGEDDDLDVEVVEVDPGTTRLSDGEDTSRR
jgi:hypothetical protein